MAEEDKQIGTALAVVEEQQKVVGSALVAASGTAVLAESTDSQMQILEQIRDIQVKTLRGIGEIAKGIKDMLSLDQLQDRRAREDATELAKENQMPQPPGPAGEGDVSEQEADKKAGGIFAFLGGLPGAGLFKKMFAPIMAFFGKGGLLVKLFGKFGPLGALILGFTLVYKYSDEIAKALAPALDGIKKLIPKLKPVTDFLLMVGDFLIKNILEGLGSVMKYVIDAVTRVVDGFKMLFDGDILGGLSEIFGGVFDFVLAIPKAILETVTNILSPLATAVGEFFTNLYNDIVTYVTDVITSIGDWFISLKNNIVQFFVDAYNNAKTQITNDINGMLSFVGDIFNTVYNAIADAVTAVKDFVVGIPDRILSFVSSMFDPIINFFSGIGTTIKNAINGIIDSLPLPDFVKNKIKFDTEPTQAEMDAGTEELKDGGEPKGGKSIVKQIQDNADKIQAYAQERGLPFDLKSTMLMNRDKEPGSQPTIMFGNSNYSDMIPLSKLDELTEKIKSGESMTASQQLKEERGTPKITMKDIKPVGEISGAGTNITNNTYNTNNSSVASQTDVHSGKLDTGIDPYFEKQAFAT